MARAVALAVVVQLAMCPTALATIRFGAAVAHDAGLKRNPDTPVIPGTLDVAVGDVNRDGIPDIAAAGDRGDVSVLLGKGGGRFGRPLLHRGRGQKESVEIAELNNDGSPDLVITNYHHDGVGVMLGRGDGHFRGVRYFKAHAGAGKPALIDVNGDGTTDAVVPNEGSTDVSVLLGRGDGTFRNPDNYRDGDAVAIAVADFDRDGIVDLVVPDDSGNLSVFFGRGHGRFKARVRYHAPGEPLSVAATDVNGDGWPDVVVGNWNGYVSLFLGSGRGRLRAPVNLKLRRRDTQAESIALADLDGDGRRDIVVTEYVSGGIAVFRNLGGGRFGRRRDYDIGTDSAIAVVAADLNADGRPDLVVGDMAVVYVALNRSSR